MEIPLDPPRHILTFPFAPNRLASECVNAYIEKLARHSSSTAPITTKKGKGRARVKLEESVSLEGGAGLSAWGSGGSLHEDWKRRERYDETFCSVSENTYDKMLRESRKEIDDVLGRWKFLMVDDFSSIKSRLRV